ncbi:MAG: 4-hydroxythreonine-4-phosphate dehydrogenase PdxA, partial [Pseudanabaena sp.]
MNIQRHLSRQSKPRIALTIGDPAGIGTEIILKSLAVRNLLTLDAEFRIFGDRRYLEATYQLLKNLKSSNIHIADPADLEIFDTRIDGEITLGVGDRASGAASFAYLDQAISQTLSGKFDAIVTAPIAKSAWKQAGHDYAGQTELLAERSEIDDFGML